MNSARKTTRTGSGKVTFSQSFREQGDFSVVVTSEVPDVEGWTMALRYELEDGQIVLAGVTFDRVEDGRPNPGTKLMRKLGFGKWQTDVLRYIREEGPGILLPRDWTDAEWNANPRPGTAGHPPDFYAVWAKRWLDAKETKSRSPIKDLAKKYPYSVDNIGQFINRAKYTVKPRMLKKVKGEWVLTAEAKRLLPQEEN